MKDTLYKVLKKDLSSLLDIPLCSDSYYVLNTHATLTITGASYSDARHIFNIRYFIPQLLVRKLQVTPLFIFLSLAK